MKDMGLKFLGAALFIFLFGMGSIGRANDLSHDCQFLLSPHLGRPVKELDGVSDQFFISFLGGGYLGNRVYRLEHKEKSQPAESLKRYTDARNLTNDVMGFDVLSPLLPPGSNFRTLKVIRVKGLDLYTDTVYGQTVESILSGSLANVSPQLELFVFHQYDRLLNWLEQKLKSEFEMVQFKRGHTEASFHDCLLAVIRTGDGQSIRLLIKPDNVVVESATQSLVIIDSH